MYVIKLNKSFSHSELNHGEGENRGNYPSLSPPKHFCQKHQSYVFIWRHLVDSHNLKKNDVACILYTSRTTGFSLANKFIKNYNKLRGTMVSYGRLTANGQICTDIWPPNEFVRKP
jgi:hypothetical protein